MKGVLFVYMLSTLGMCCGFFSPFIGVCVYVLFGVMAPNALWYYSLPPTYLNTGFGFSEVVAYPMILGWFMNRCGNLNIGKAYMPLFLLCGYNLWVFISMMFTSWSPAGFAQVLMNVRLLLAIFIVVSLCDTVQKLRIILWCLLFGSGFVAYELNMSYLGGFNRLQMVGYSGMDNNFFAVSMVVGAVVAFFIGLSERNIVLKGLAFLAAVLQAHVVMFSMSRGGMLGLGIAGFFAFLTLPKTGSNMAMYAIFVAVGISLFGPSAQERFFSSFKNMEDLDGSAQSRLFSWKNCMVSIKEKPFLGVGIQKWATYSSERFGVTLEAHSTWLQAAVESGIPALFFLLGFFMLTVLRLIPFVWGSRKVPDPRIATYMQMTITGTMAYCISAQFVSLYAMENVFYMATVGLVCLKLVHLKEVADAEEETARMFEMRKEMEYSLMS